MLALCAGHERQAGGRGRLPAGLHPEGQQAARQAHLRARLGCGPRFPGGHPARAAEVNPWRAGSLNPAIRAARSCALIRKAGSRRPTAETLGSAPAADSTARRPVGCSPSPRARVTGWRRRAECWTAGPRSGCCRRTSSGPGSTASCAALRACSSLHEASGPRITFPTSTRWTTPVVGMLVMLSSQTTCSVL